jgi:hypothetical protein
MAYIAVMNHDHIIYIKLKTTLASHTLGKRKVCFLVNKESTSKLITSISQVSYEQKQNSMAVEIALTTMLVLQLPTCVAEISVYVTCI